MGVNVGFGMAVGGVVYVEGLVVGVGIGVVLKGMNYP